MWAPVGPQLGPSWAQLGPGWAPVGPDWGPFGNAAWEEGAVNLKRAKQGAVCGQKEGGL